MKGYRELLKKLSAIVEEQHLQPGDRLPPERELAPKLGISRNTLRNILHKLETHRLVSVRKGSGTYLHTCSLEFEDVQEFKGYGAAQLMAERCEAAYLMLPTVASQAAHHIGLRLIDRLQQCNIALSRNLLSGSVTDVSEDMLSFFRIFAQGTNNRYFVDVVEQVCVLSELHEMIIDRLTQEQKDRLFASHVKLIHAFRERDGERAADFMRQYVLFFSYAAEQHCGIQATDLVFAAMQEQEGG